jgi:hypothetical protein
VIWGIARVLTLESIRGRRASSLPCRKEAGFGRLEWWRSPITRLKGNRRALKRTPPANFRQPKYLDAHSPNEGLQHRQTILFIRSYLRDVPLTLVNPKTRNPGGRSRARLRHSAGVPCSGNSLSTVERLGLSDEKDLLGAWRPQVFHSLERSPRGRGRLFVQTRMAHTHHPLRRLTLIT